MATTPTPTNIARRRNETHPSPPIEAQSPAEGTVSIDQARCTQMLIARGNATHCTTNTARQQPVVLTDWVLEPEVPQPSGTFLAWPTRRCFMNDYLQARVQVSNVLLSGTSEVEIEVWDQDLINDRISFIGTDQGAVDAATSFPRREHRELRVDNNIGEAQWSDTGSAILLETDQTRRFSYLLTTIHLPIDPSGVERDDLEYYFRVRVTDGALSITATSPVITALRWSVHPEENLNQPETNATTFRPLIDGEACFAECARLINSARQSIYISSWSFWLDTFLTGEPAGGGERLSDRLMAAANRGVRIYVLLDRKNAGWARPLIETHLRHTEIMVKTHTHPFEYDRIHERLVLGSYHEKYMSVDGQSAIVGGIDFMPDRYQNPNHDWVSDSHRFNDQAIARGLSEFPAGLYFILWHDIAVLFEGNLVTNLNWDFVRRWNTAETGNQLTQPSRVTSHAGLHCQIVKTDSDPRRLGVQPEKGTYNAYINAIREARHYIYIENQYLNYRRLGDAIYDALAANSELQAIIVLPFVNVEVAGVAQRRFAPVYWVQFWEGWLNETELRDRLYLHGEYLQAQIINRLRSLPNVNNQVGIYALAGCKAGATNGEMIYPHSKIAIVDDNWAIIGSANTNGRGFELDSEMNVIVQNRGVVSRFRRDLWQEHLGVDLPTRRIRNFLTEWNNIAHSSRDRPSDFGCSEVLLIRAAHFPTPARGQRYNGALGMIGNPDIHI